MTSNVTDLVTAEATPEPLIDLTGELDREVYYMLDGRNGPIALPLCGVEVALGSRLIGNHSPKAVLFFAVRTHDRLIGRGRFARR